MTGTITLVIAADGTAAPASCFFGENATPARRESVFSEFRLRHPDGGRAFCPGGVFDRKTQTAILSDPSAQLQSTTLRGWRPREHLRWASVGRIIPDHPLLWTQSRIYHETVSWSYLPCSSAGRIGDLKSRCRGFNSHRGRQKAPTAEKSSQPAHNRS